MKNPLDDQISRYFEGRAGEVRPPAVPTTTIVARGRRRRHRRTAARCSAALGAVGLLAGAVALRAGDGHPEQQAATFGTPTSSQLEWDLVTPKQGIGWTSDTATTADGIVYDLSTAPANGPNGNTRPHLYRSGDGAEWSEVALPDGFHPVDLAAEDDTLYAVSTAPGSGGASQVDVATSRSGGHSWDHVRLPIDLRDGEADAFLTPSVARSGGRTLVAVDVGATSERIDAILGAAGIDPRRVGQLFADGVDVFDPCMVTPVEPEGPSSEVTPPTMPAEGSVPSGASGCNAAPQRRTWAQLGISEADAATLAGRTLMFTAGADGVFTAAGELASERGSTKVVAGDDGFWAISERMDAEGDVAVVSYSADGRTWDGSDHYRLQGTVVASGDQDGVPNLITVVHHQWPSSTEPEPEAAPSETILVHRLGSRHADSTDLTAVVGKDVHMEASAAIGPLGFAVIASVDRVDTVIHSTPEGGVAMIALPAAPAGKRQTVNGVAVSADAITVRLNLYPEGDDTGGDEAKPEQRLFVGTPS